MHPMLRAYGPAAWEETRLMLKADMPPTQKQEAAIDYCTVKRNIRNMNQQCVLKMAHAVASTLKTENACKKTWQQLSQLQSLIANPKK